MTTPPERIEEKLVKHLVDRFCGWHLPKDFHPDGGIMFMDVYDNGTENGGTFEPTGTNLFTAEQAKEMFRFLLEHEDGTPILTELLHQELQKAREKEEAIKAERKRILLEVEKIIARYGITAPTMQSLVINKHQFMAILKEEIITQDQSSNKK